MKCPACEREVPDKWMERHHLRTRRTDKEAIERLCKDCHKTLHGLFPHRDLRNPRLSLDTLDGLLADERFRRALSFIRKVPPGTFMRMKESHHRRKAHRR